MRYINVRQLTRNLNEVVAGGLPVTVTKNGIPWILIDGIPSGTKPEKMDFKVIEKDEYLDFMEAA